MITKAPFELTNKQRKYLGLSPVGDTWELIYFANQYLYYDGDIIRKKITIDDDGTYYEAELCEYTEQNRTILLPKTKRGKPKKMNYTATLSFQPFWSLLQIFGQPNYHCQLHDPNHILPRRKSE